MKLTFLHPLTASRMCGIVRPHACVDTVFIHCQMDKCYCQGKMCTIALTFMTFRSSLELGGISHSEEIKFNGLRDCVGLFSVRILF